MQQHQRGAALLMAIIILSGLLLLGLPFLFSQTLSLAGSQSFQAGQATLAARETAVDLGLGMAESGMAEHLRVGTAIYSMFDLDLEAAFSDPNVLDFDAGLPHTVAIDVRSLAGAEGWTDVNAVTPGGTRLGLALVDEGGKVDVNALDAVTWQQILSAAGAGGSATDLAAHRFRKYDLTPREPQYIERLDEFVADGLLTEQDLARLDPYITVHGLGQAREGQVDLGTVTAVRKRVRVTVDVNTTAALSGNHRIRVSVDGQTQTRNRNLDIGDSWSRSYTFTFWVNNINATPSVTLEQPDGSGGSSASIANTERRFSLQCDGPLQASVVAGTIVVLETPDQSNRLIFRAPATTTSDEDDISWDYVPADEVQSRVNTYTQAVGRPLRIAKETMPGVNIHHAPTPLLEALVDTAQAPAESLDPSTQYPISSYVTNTSALSTVENDAVWRSLNPLRALTTERVPLALRSWGVVGIDARSTMGDGLDRPLSSLGVREVAQVGAGANTTITFETQAEFEASHYGRNLSQIHTWPQPTTRLTDTLPNEAAAADELLTPITLDTYADLNDDQPSNVRLDWWRTLRGADTNDFLGTVNATGGTVNNEERPATAAGVGTVFPDGVDITGELAYRTDASNGPIRAAGARNEVGGRHLSLWIKPSSALNDGDTLLEMRAPAGNTFAQVNGTAGSNENQNIWRLYWNSAGFLVLRLCGPSIEHTSDEVRSDGTIISAPEDVFGDNSVFVNEQSLGNDHPDAAPLAPAVPFHGVEYYYYLDNPLEAGRWYHLQVVVSHSRPGGQTIMVDGLAGRDVSKVTGSVALQRGDHATLPTMILDQDLPEHWRSGGGGGFVPYYTLTAGADLNIGNLALRPNAIATALSLDASALFPSRGTIIIGNEYLSYSGISGNTLENVYRSLRANTNTGAGSVEDRWPVIDQHYADNGATPGDLVMPGAYRFQPGGNLLRGATTTLHDLPNGDPTPGSSLQWRMWAEASNTDTDHNLVPDDHTHPDCATGDMIGYILNGTLDLDDDCDPTTPDIVLQPNESLTIGTIYGSTNDAFPATGGVILIDGDRDLATNDKMVFWYDAFDGTQFTGLVPYTVPGITNVTPAISWNMDTDDAPAIILLSLEVTAGLGIENTDNFRQTGGQDDLLLQIEDPTTNRIEWLHYDVIVNDLNGTGRDFFINIEGWARGDRGQQRTVFAGDYTTITGLSTLATDVIFPTASNILPVQNQSGGAYWLATGDVITIMPHTVPNPITAETTPTQMVIRFAATDGYYETLTWTPDPALDPSLDRDTKNEWFTFTEQVPADFDLATVEYLVGNAWSGRDLSVLGTATLVNGLMPRMDMMDAGRDITALTSGDDARLYIGAGDSRRGGSSGSTLRLDGFASGSQYGATAGTSNLGEVTHIYQGDTEVAGFDDGTAGLGLILRVDSGQSWGSGTSLVRIGGEIMAVTTSLNGTERQDIFDATGNWPNSLYAKIIGRGLLGSQATGHRIAVSYSPDDPADIRYRKGPTVLHLPIGPVREVTDALTIDYDALLSGSTSQPPSAWLVSSPMGAVNEIIATPNGRVSPWLRGYYHTVVQDWSTDFDGANSGADLHHLLIGWYPRYPSALPNGRPGHLSDREWSDMLRSRSYAWAGFALRQRDMIPMTAQVWTDFTNSSGFGMIARAWADDFDWIDAPNQNLSSGGNQTLNIFTGSGGNSIIPSGQTGVDGAELKLHWIYTGSTESDFRTIMSRINQTPPSIRRVHLEAESPTIILERSEAR